MSTGTIETDWAVKHCGMYSTMGSVITVDRLALRELIQERNDLLKKCKSLGNANKSKTREKQNGNS